MADSSAPVRAETAKASSSRFVRKYSRIGTDRPAPAGVLVDVCGNPLPSSDTATVDINGRPQQAETDPYALYQPRGPEFTYEQARRKSEEALAKARRKERYSQGQVDEVRYRVVLLMARDALRDRRQVTEMYHLWWPKAEAPDVYELRQGNPPSDWDRPVHLRRLDLEVDLTAGIPDDIAELMRPNGGLDSLVKEAMEDDPNPMVSGAQILMETVKRLAAVYAWRGGSRR